MPKFLENLSYKFFIDIAWKNVGYFSPIFFGGAGYLMKDYIIATLLGLGSFGIIAFIKNHFNKHNDIESKILIIFEPFSQINIDPKLQSIKLIPFIDVHNCSNQIIYYEMIENENYFKLDGDGKPSTFEFDRTSALLPPYFRGRIVMYDKQLNFEKEEFILDIKIAIKYRTQNSGKEYKLEKIFSAQYQKTNNTVNAYKCI